MRRVLIESPFAAPTPEGVEEHIRYARACIRDALAHGDAPLASHLLYTQEGILDDNVPEERAWGIEAGVTWYNTAEACIVYTDCGISRGMQYGIERAQKLGIPVEYRTVPGWTPASKIKTAHKKAAQKKATIKAILIDMDDTLIVNQVYYAAARAKLEGYLSSFGIHATLSGETLNRIDADNYTTYGLSRERFPTSFEMTLKHFIPDASAEMVAVVRGFAEEVFQVVAATKPGVVEALRLLAQDYPIHIVTAGDRTVQEFRIANLPFRNLIKRAFIVDKKTPDAFKNIVAELGYKPDEVIMIGDSLTSDAAPSTAAGIPAVVIDPELMSSDFHPAHSGNTALPANTVRYSSLLELARSVAAQGRLTPPQAANNNTPPKPGKGRAPKPPSKN